MGGRRLSDEIFRRFRVLPGERPLALLLFAYFFLITAPHTIIKTLRTAGLLMELGVGALPYAYLLAAGVTGLAVFAHTKVQARLSLPATIVSGLLFFAVSGLVLQAAIVLEIGKGGFLPYVYWVWASVLIVVLMTHFWLLVDGIFDPREAKRLVGFIGSGGILGGVAGGLAAALLTRLDLSLLLLPLACALLLGCVAVVRSLARRLRGRPLVPAAAAGAADARTSKPVFKESLSALRSSQYLRLLALIVAAAVIVSTVIEFQFLSAAYAEKAASRKDLQEFLGLFLAVLTFLAFLVNALFTSRILRKLLTFAVLTTPVILLFGAAAVLIAPFGLLPVVFLKGGDGILTFSLNQSVREVLYIPVVAELKAKAKPFIDMFVSQAAKVVGALALLAFAFLTGREIKGVTPVFDPGLAQDLGWIVLGFLALWAVSGLLVRKEYLAAVRKRIRVVAGPERGETIVDQRIDAESVRLIIDAVDPRNVSSVMFALDAFDLLERKKLGPEAKKMILEKAGEVRLAALNELFGAEEASGFPEASDAAAPGGLAADIREILSSEAYQQVMVFYAEGVLGRGREAEAEKKELARAIGSMGPSAPLAAMLPRLIGDESPDVASLAIQSAGRLRRQGHVPAIIARLGHPLTRADAVDALDGYGSAAVPALAVSLSDPSKDLEQRRGIVEALARMRSTEAVGVLGSALALGSGGLDPEIIDALDLIRSENETLPMPAGMALVKIRALVRQYCGIYLELQRLGPGERNDVRRRVLGRELAGLVADIFKLLGLSHPHKDVNNAYRNLWTENHGHAVELLDNILNPDVRGLVLPIVEDLDGETRTRQIRRTLKSLKGD
jgi:AAA family ATP:ADP antiporter